MVNLLIKLRCAAHRAGESYGGQADGKLIK